MVELGWLADVPVVGVVFGVIALVAMTALVLVALPFLLIGLVEALLLALLAGAGLVAATLAGRPLLVRAEQVDGPAHLAWAVKGWDRSRRVRDRVVEQIRAGADVRSPGSVAADLVYDAESVTDRSGPVEP